MKSLYNMLKISKYRFITYYIYYKKKFKIKKFIYNFYFYNSNLLKIIKNIN